MIIRPFKQEDFKAVVDLLKLTSVEPPHEPTDLNGLCFVAEDEGKIVGCVWALVGHGTQAYIDFFSVNPEYQYTHLGWNLIKTMDAVLKKTNIHRYTFFVEPGNEQFIKLINKYREANKITRLRDLRFFRRELL